MEISKENLYVDCEQSLNLHNFNFSLAARGSEERSRTTARGLICM